MAVTKTRRSRMIWGATAFLAMRSPATIEAFSLPLSSSSTSTTRRANNNNFSTVRRSSDQSSALSAALPPMDVVESFNVVSMYKEALTTNPFETNMITGGVLACIGDAIAQSREKDQPYDAKRAGAFVVFDICYRALQTTLFPTIVAACDGHFMGSLLPSAAAQNLHLDMTNFAVLEQTLANQLGVIPLFYYPLFFTLTGVVQGLTLEANIERAKTTVVPLLKRNWTFWIPVQYFQFGYVDEPLQIPFLCVAGLAWTCILSAAAGSVKSFNEDDGVDEQDLELIVQMDYSKEEKKVGAFDDVKETVEISSRR